MNDTIAGLAGLTDRTVTTHGRHRVLRMRRRYATDIADLWSAWTDPVRPDRRWSSASPTRPGTARR